MNLAVVESTNCQYGVGKHNGFNNSKLLPRANSRFAEFRVEQVLNKLTHEL